MRRYVLGRLVQTALTLVGVSVIVFGLARLSGDPVQIMAPPEASAEDIERLRAKLGLAEPVAVQYARFVRDAVRGDFGDSIRWQVPAMSLILERFPATLLLAGTSIALGVALAIPAGVLAAVRRSTFLDTAARLSALVGQSMPTFWLGLLLILAFAFYLASAWWIVTLPGAAIMLTVLSVNLLGDWLRDRLDPRLRRIAA